MYKYLLKYPHLFPAVLGISQSQFLSLLPKFSCALRRAENQKAFSKKRLRQPGAGRKPAVFKCDIAKLFFILFYYKVYPTFRLASVFFQLDIHSIFYWKEFLEPVLSQTIDYQLQLPKVKARVLNDVIKVCPQLSEFIADATERYIQRSQNSKVQKLYYSGKKKRHTVKNHILVNPRNKRILAVSSTVEGKKHDKKLLEEDPILIHAPPNAKALTDTGYQGMNDSTPWIKFVMPKKKPPGGKLSSSDKRNNKQISSIRVKGEHPFAYLKHFNVLQHTFRNQIDKAHTPFVTLATLYNFTRTHH